MKESAGNRIPSPYRQSILRKLASILHLCGMALSEILWDHLLVSWLGREHGEKVEKKVTLGTKWPLSLDCGDEGSLREYGKGERGNFGKVTRNCIEKWWRYAANAEERQRSVGSSAALSVKHLILLMKRWRWNGCWPWMSANNWAFVESTCENFKLKRSIKLPRYVHLELTNYLTSLPHHFRTFPY